MNNVLSAPAKAPIPRRHNPGTNDNCAKYGFDILIIPGSYSGHR